MAVARSESIFCCPRACTGLCFREERFALGVDLAAGLAFVLAGFFAGVSEESCGRALAAGTAAQRISAQSAPTRAFRVPVKGRVIEAIPLPDPQGLKPSS